MEILSIKHVGTVIKFLGKRVVPNEGTSFIDQESAIVELLEHHGLKNAKEVRSPIVDENNDMEDNAAFLSVQAITRIESPICDFQSLVGRLLCVSRFKKPDISFAVHKATLHTHRPRKNDWKRAKRVARYLKNTKSMKLKIN